MLDGLPHANGCSHSRSDSTNTRPVMALALSPMPTLPIFRKAPTPGLLSSLDDWPWPTTPRRCYCREAIEPDRHPLILDGLAVTFYLVFKEPVLLVRLPLASRPSSGEPFKLTNPPRPVSSLYFGSSQNFDPRAAYHRSSPASRHDIHPLSFGPFGQASHRSPCLPAFQTRARHGAGRILELEGRDARRPVSTWAAVRLPLRARHLAASLTNIRPRDGRVNRESRKT